MKKEKNVVLQKVRGYLVPFIVLPSVAGLFTGAVVFFFRLAASYVMMWSSYLYEAVRTHLGFLPLLLLGVAALAVLCSLITNYSPMSRGGGIPTAIAALRGLLTFRWLRTLFCVFFSSIISFFAGIPLGNEGPSVQMGTSVGRGVCRMTGKKYRAADRYVMTGGASSGFAVATGAPIAGVFFALEDAHRRFTPTIVLSAFFGVLSGYGFAKFLSWLIPLPSHGFRIPELPQIPPRFILAVVVVGMFAALANVTQLAIYEFLQKKRTWFARFPRTVRLVILFTVTAALGLILPGVLGTGLDVTNDILSAKFAWYLLILFFLLRALLTLSASVAGVTGGLFIPLIAFGALSGGLCARLLVLTGLVGEEYFAVLTVIGIAAFLGAALKTPITAVIFAIEVFGALPNSPYLLLGVSTAFLLTELFGHESINDTVMGYKIAAAVGNSKKEIVDIKLTVQPGAFVIGKETRDILWPTACRILAIRTSPYLPPARHIRQGDILHIHFETRDFATTAEEFCALLGEQDIPLRYAEDMADEPHEALPTPNTRGES